MRFCRGSQFVVFCVCAAAVALGQSAPPAGNAVQPDSSGALPAQPQASASAAPTQPSVSQWQPVARTLTFEDRLGMFWHDSYASPGALVSLSTSALIDEATDTPAKWNKDGDGYTRRFGSAYGQLAARNGIHYGMASFTGLDPRYSSCACRGLLHRASHALEMSFVTYRRDGRLTLDVPQVAGAYGSGMISTYWYPHQLYSPLVQGVQFGHQEMGEVFLSNLVQEFGPDMKHAFHFRSSGK